ncbi:MAG TPA: ribulokinase, partial [Methylomirabilota bacterium]|nr:ribulokinase [Methylomirabilota bacterium]
MADSTGVPVIVPETPEPVLLGSAMLGAVAGRLHPTLPDAMSAMSRTADRIEPGIGAAIDIHAGKRRVFDLLRRLERDSRAIMATVPGDH